jgi:hypothetical protein
MQPQPGAVTKLSYPMTGYLERICGHCSWNLTFSSSRWNGETTVKYSLVVQTSDTQMTVHPRICKDDAGFARSNTVTVRVRQGRVMITIDEERMIENNDDCNQ